MNQINEGGPAFPGENDADKEYNWVSRGMSMRDWFAGQALGAVVRSYLDRGLDDDSPTTGNPPVIDAAELAYSFADAMLKVRDWEEIHDFPFAKSHAARGF